MDDHDARPMRQVQVREVEPGTAGFEQVLTVAARVLAQDRYLTSRLPHALESHVLGAFDGTPCIGFLRYLIQVIGAEAGRPAVMHDGEPLREGYVEAFGVGSTENYALKIAAGYVLHPSHENDSYYFLLRL